MITINVTAEGVDLATPVGRQVVDTAGEYECDEGYPRRPMTIGEVAAVQAKAAELIAQAVREGIGR